MVQVLSHSSDNNNNHVHEWTIVAVSVDPIYREMLQRCKHCGFERATRAKLEL